MTETAKSTCDPRYVIISADSVSRERLHSGLEKLPKKWNEYFERVQVYTDGCPKGCMEGTFEINCPPGTLRTYLFYMLDSKSILRKAGLRLLAGQLFPETPIVAKILWDMSTYRSGLHTTQAIVQTCIMFNCLYQLKFAMDMNPLPLTFTDYKSLKASRNNAELPYPVVPLYTEESLATVRVPNPESVPMYRGTLFYLGAKHDMVETPDKDLDKTNNHIHSRSHLELPVHHYNHSVQRAEERRQRGYENPYIVPKKNIKEATDATETNITESTGTEDVVSISTEKKQDGAEQNNTDTQKEQKESLYFDNTPAWERPAPPFVPFHHNSDTLDGVLACSLESQKIMRDVEARLQENLEYMHQDEFTDVIGPTLRNHVQNSYLHCGDNITYDRAKELLFMQKVVDSTDPNTWKTNIHCIISTI